MSYPSPPCEYPLTNLGDFANNPDAACELNFPVTRGLWGFAAVIHGAVLLFAARGLRAKVQSRPKTFHREPSTWRLGILGLYGSLIAACGALEASAAAPGARSIGRDLTTTLCFSCGAACVFYSLILAQLHALRVNVQMMRFRRTHAANKLDRVLARVKFAFWPQLVLCLFQAFCPLGMVDSDASTNFGYVWAQLHFFLGAGQVMFAACFYELELQALIADVRASRPVAGEQTLLDIHRSLRATRISLWLNCLLNGCFAFTFGLIPSLTAQAAYLLSVSWAVGAFGNLRVIRQVLNPPKPPGPAPVAYLDSAANSKLASSAAVVSREST